MLCDGQLVKQVGYVPYVSYGFDKSLINVLLIVVRKFSSELWFEPKPPRTELRVQFKVYQNLLNRTLGTVQGSTKSLLV